MISLVGKSHFLDKAPPVSLMGSLLLLMSRGLYCLYLPLVSESRFDLIFAHHLNFLSQLDFVFAGK